MVSNVVSKKNRLLELKTVGLKSRRSRTNSTPRHDRLQGPLYRSYASGRKLCRPQRRSGRRRRPASVLTRQARPLLGVSFGRLLVIRQNRKRRMEHLIRYVSSIRRLADGGSRSCPLSERTARGLYQPGEAHRLALCRRRKPGRVVIGGAHTSETKPPPDLRLVKRATTTKTTTLTRKAGMKAVSGKNGNAAAVTTTPPKIDATAAISVLRFQ